MLPVLHQDEAVAAADLQPPGGCWLQAGAGQSLGLQDVADGYFKMLFILVRQVYRGIQGQDQGDPGLRFPKVQDSGCKGFRQLNAVLQRVVGYCDLRGLRFGAV